jgi:hypothetical protein
MALPKIKHPTFKVTIPSLKQEVTLRPFTVQEEKILLMAKSSEKTEDIVSAVKQVIQNCITEPVDVDRLATFDIEYLFIKLRAKSVGEIVDLEYTDPDTKELIKFKINLDDVEVKHNPEHTNKLPVFDDVGIVMRYPTLEEIEKVESDQNREEAAFKMLLSCIDKIYDNNTVYTDYNEKELADFVNTLPMESMNKVREFFETMPSVEHEVELKNKKGTTKNITLKGITSFFT